MIRQNEARWRSRAAVVLDVHPDGHDAESFEVAVEAVASIVTRLVRLQRRVEVATSAGEFLRTGGDPRHDVIDRLATVGPHSTNRLAIVLENLATHRRADLVIAVLGRAGPDVVRVLSSLAGISVVAVLTQPVAFPPSNSVVVVDASRTPFATAWNQAFTRSSRTQSRNLAWQRARASSPPSPSPRERGGAVARPVFDPAASRAGAAPPSPPSARRRGRSAAVGLARPSSPGRIRGWCWWDARPRSSADRFGLRRCGTNSGRVAPAPLRSAPARDRWRLLLAVVATWTVATSRYFAVPSHATSPVCSHRLFVWSSARDVEHRDILRCLRGRAGAFSCRTSPYDDVTLARVDKPARARWPCRGAARSSAVAIPRARAGGARAENDPSNFASTSPNHNGGAATHAAPLVDVGAKLETATRSSPKASHRTGGWQPRSTTSRRPAWEGR
jgi:hypothetical protein